MKRSLPIIIAFLVCALMLAFAVYAGISLFSTNANAAAPEAHYYIYKSVTPETPDSPGLPSMAPAVGSEAPSYRLLPENGRVLFIGNSLVQGLEAACDDDGHGFICKKGLSLTGLPGILPENPGDGFDIAVVEMGSNELGLWSEEDFKSSYSDILDRLQCQAVCLSVPPVCEPKSKYESRVSCGNAALCSEWIKDVCDVRDDAVYLDCYGFFGDTLDPAWTGDGLHLTGRAYSDWYGWIMSELTAERPVE